VDIVSTVTILDTGDYTLKVAQSAITKCWRVYPTILWRTGLLLTWSLLPDVIQQLRRHGLPVSEIKKNGIPHYIHCQHHQLAPFTDIWEACCDHDFLPAEDSSVRWTLGVTFKGISSSGIIRLFTPKLLSWQFGEDGVRIFHPSLACAVSASVISSLKKPSHCGFTGTICCS
jgi:hypothetical protein